VKKQNITAHKIEAAKSLTFGECARKYVAAHEASWKNGKHAAQWRTTFEGSSRAKAATAAINNLPVSEIDTALALKVLEPIWKNTPETASRVRQRCEQVIAWAAARDYREKGSNPFGWRGHLDKLLPKPSKVKRVKHHPALPYTEMPAFMAEVRGSKSISAHALEFLILTACRTSEVICAIWDEIHFAEKTWTIPADRMKAGKEHKVPLPPRAVEILQALPREDGNPHVFIGGRKGAPLSNMAMLEFVKAMRPGYVPHGFRSTFRDWAAECTNYPNHVVEKALAHTVADKVEAAYRRGDLFEKRRRLMTDWSRYCVLPPAKAGGVTPFRRRRASA
jgi:integrase